MKIERVVLSEGKTGFYFDDQAAIKAGASNDGLRYVGDPITNGFDMIRIPGESISVQLVLSDKQVALGDCVAVQYSGASGREPLFIAKTYIKELEEVVVPWLKGLELNSFIECSKKLETLEYNGHPLHTGIKYGVSLALLDAFAKANHLSIAQFIQKEYKLQFPIKRVPIFTQSGDDRYLAADKMILKNVEALPHALINNVETKLGKDGSKLKEYLVWLMDRIKEIGSADYKPTIHLDVYGTIGEAFNLDIKKQAQYIKELEELVKPFPLVIEGPMDAGSKNKQIKQLQDLVVELKNIDSKAKIVADEWCNNLEDIKEFVDAKAGDIMQIKTPDLGCIHNTIEAVLYCNENNIGGYVGGSCNETDVSSRITTNVALASGAVQILAKPGMGVDEAYMIVYNEMNRIISLLES
ncbi:MAG: methylaspartate ammonia-lyase [Erysipelotrichales bacterium]